MTIHRLSPRVIRVSERVEQAQGRGRRAVLVVAVLLLVALGAAVVDRLQGPSESECKTQRIEVMGGQRLAVDDACRR
jgi:hypothetical protein